MKSIALALSVLLAAAALGGQTAAEKVADPSRPIVNVQPPENSILKSALLKTEWKNVRNPFRFEVAEAHPIETDRFEQMQVTGFARLPDAHREMRTFVFVTKTSEQPKEQDAPKTAQPKAGQATVTAVTETYALESFPEILDQETVPTDEQIEHSSITLLHEQLWFIGILTTTNHQHVAVFWPYGPYPVKEESLRQFEVADALKEVPIRVTRFGEKIGGRAGHVPILAKTQKRPEAEAAVQRQGVGPAPKATSPVAKPSISIESDTEVDQSFRANAKPAASGTATNPPTPPAVSSGTALNGTTSVAK